MKKRYSRGKIIRLIVTAIIFAALLIAAEVAARNWLLVNRPSRYAIFAEHTPAPYVDSPYYSLAFLSEQSKAVRASRVDQNGEFTSDFHGQWYNFDDGYRRTTDQPDKADHTVYVFGNSTVLSFEVPDQYTIPSQLQMLFNATMHDKYRVINLGRNGYFANRELHLLKMLLVKPGDLVIFYDGIVDAQIGGGQTEPETLPMQFCSWLSDKLPNLSLGKIYCLLTPTRGPSTDQLWWAKNVESVESAYERNLVEAQRYSASKQVQFYHFLEPTIFSRPLSPYEQATVANPLIVGDVRIATATTLRTWPTLQAVNLKLSNSGMNTTDLTHILDPIRSQGVEVYVDLYHVNERANEIVAKAIFSAITHV